VLISHTYTLSKKPSAVFAFKALAKFACDSLCDQNSAGNLRTSHHDITRRQRLAGFAFGHLQPHQLTRLSSATATNIRDTLVSVCEGHICL
jgi:hypothetical protein